MKDTDKPAPKDASQRPTADRTGDCDASRRNAGTPADSFAELLNHSVGQPGEDCPNPTDGSGTAPDADRAGERAAEAEVDPPYVGRYQVIRALGQGSFGRVYLARDADLHRQVAIKVPRNRDSGARVDLEMYLNEARIVARLSHPNIVPVHDVGHTDDGRGFIVSMFVNGGDLAARLKAGRPAFAESARLAAALCDAMHHAHTRDLFHRDIKPANILIDEDGVPYLADFGLALKDEDYGKGPRFAGTVAYTSPEQARGEGHLVDGRSDIFSMGVVFYEMLTGRRPFRGESRPQVFRQIISSEPRPPRQIDDTIPRELERICLKAIAKRASERYSIARDMAEDLRHYLEVLATASGTEVLKTPPPPLAAAPYTEATPYALPPSGQSDLTARPIKVVPRGLCAFDEHDVDFFLELLPGPRDRDGLPDLLRFWKTRIEATEAEKTFRVGLIYGPSGCGKSSLLKAGLLPLLGAHVTPVYVEATAGETEASLHRGLRKEFPELAGDSGLVESLANLRRNRSMRVRRKVILVLDQFEQWLFARGRDQGAELVAALRQCDGEHVQALCLVRDDFWMAATRLMMDLEIDLVPHRNVSAVDLFDAKHARKVLAAFGRAYGGLPAAEGNPSREQNAFLEQATAGLAEDGRIVPVRLALFAEMVKAKPWTPETLREVGGMDGVGVRFLEETFSSSRANPEHRYHQKAAQAVLKSLLPETNSDIKGRMRSSHELRLASGYNDRQCDFDHLIRILDGSLRLITPVDLESSDEPDAAVKATGSRYYQLTHDYLVRSLRDWLTRKQKSTRRGRAELLLAERSALWNAKPEGHHLPSIREWAHIRLLTKPVDWTEPERRMMRRSGRKVAIRAFVTAAALGGLLVVGVLLRRSINETYDSKHATDLVLRLKSALIAKVPESIAEMRDYRRWTDPELKKLLKLSAHEPDRKLRASLALLPVDPGQVEYLSGRLIDASPGELSVLCDFLAGHSAALCPRIWALLEANGPDDSRVLGYSGALARFDPDSPRWKGVAAKTARAMVSVNPIHVSDWLAIFRPVKDRLRGALKEILRDGGRDETDRVHAMNYLVDYASDSPGELVDLLQEAGAKEFAMVFPEVERRREQTLSMLEQVVGDDNGPPASAETEKDRRAERQAKAAVALLRLGASEHVWPLLSHSSDPRIRSFLIHWLTRLGDLSGTMRSCLQVIETAAQAKSTAGTPGQKHPLDDPNRSTLFDPSSSIRRALFLVVGHFDPDHLPVEDRGKVIRKLLEVYRDDPDPGIHGAARWALWRYSQGEQLRGIDSALSQIKENGKRRWFVNTVGQTMVSIEGPLQFRMGESANKPEYQDEIQHERRIPRRFAIASTEVSIGEFQKFWKQHFASFPEAQMRPGSVDLPRGGVTWYMAAAYCNWLSEKEDRKPVYGKNKHGQYAEGMLLEAAAFDGGGYRLPTEAEWEYACRAGAETSRYFGNSWGLLRQYARLTSWEEVSPLPCGSLLPNDFGLFDMLGNLAEWCHDGDYDYLDFANGMKTDFQFQRLIDSHYRVLRGASFVNRPPDACSAARAKYEPALSHFSNGFRVAMSLP